MQCSHRACLCSDSSDVGNFFHRNKTYDKAIHAVAGNILTNLLLTCSTCTLRLVLCSMDDKLNTITCHTFTHLKYPDFLSFLFLSVPSS